MLTFQEMRIRTRLIIAGTAVLIGLASMAGYALIRFRHDALAAHSERIKDLVESAHGVIVGYQKLEEEGTLDREEAQHQAKEALRPLRFGSNDYYFIYDYDGQAIMAQWERS